MFCSGTTLDDLGASYNLPVTKLIIDNLPAAINPINRVMFTNNLKLSTMFVDAVPLIYSVLAAHNIVLEGAIIYKKAPDSCSIWADHGSAPLSVLLAHCLKKSDNLYAHCIFKTLGSFKEEWSWMAATQVVKSFLSTHTAIEPDDLKLVDGSGLSRYTILTPHQVASLLVWATQKSYFPTFFACLPLAGVDGTLQNRMEHIGRRIRAKTGTAGGISSLAGYIELEHDTLVFVIFINGFVSYASYYKSELEDALYSILVRTLG